MSSMLLIGFVGIVLVLVLLLAAIAFHLKSPSNVDWREGISDDELAIMRDRTQRKANAQIEREATKKFRDLTRR